MYIRKASLPPNSTPFFPKEKLWDVSSFLWVIYRYVTHKWLRMCGCVSIIRLRTHIYIFSLFSSYTHGSIPYIPFCRDFFHLTVIFKDLISTRLLPHSSICFAFSSDLEKRCSKSIRNSYMSFTRIHRWSVFCTIYFIIPTPRVWTHSIHIYTCTHLASCAFICTHTQIFLLIHFRARRERHVPLLCDFFKCVIPKSQDVLTQTQPFYLHFPLSPILYLCFMLVMWVCVVC